jgi:redox-sensitive bicupin YhaK (pirin superfamily)
MTFDPDVSKDPLRDGFRALHGLNEDRLAPGFGIPIHSRRDVEILTYVLDGLIVHEDDMGHAGVIRSGDFQHVTAGRGFRQSRINGSRLDSAHVFETRFRTDTEGLPPRCVQTRFSAADRKGVFFLVASPDALRSSFHIRQDVQVFSSLPDRGCHLVHVLLPGRQAWLHVVTGRVVVEQLALIAGDGVAFQDEVSVSVTALVPSELLLFDLA